MAHSKRRSVGLFAVVVSLGFLAGVALAKEEFPGEVARHLGAKMNPPCGLCHEYGKTGGATLVTPFAWAMRARGMTDGSSLIMALDRVAADKVDSDGDGALDVDEIVAGTDPNSAASTPAHPGAFGDPQLGCSLAGAGGGAWLSSAAALVAVGLAARRRRRGAGA